MWGYLSSSIPNLEALAEIWDNEYLIHSLLLIIIIIMLITAIFGEGNSNPLQYSCLENSMDRGAWQATVYGVTKSQTWLSNYAHHCMCTHIALRLSYTVSTRNFPAKVISFLLMILFSLSWWLVSPIQLNFDKQQSLFPLISQSQATVGVFKATINLLNRFDLFD